MTRIRTALAATALAALVAAAPAAAATEQLFAGDGTPLGPPHLAAAGRIAVAAWDETDPGTVRAVIRRAGDWGRPATLPVQAPAVVWDVAVDGRGIAMVAVVERITSAHPGLRVFSAGANGRWTPSTQLAPSGVTYLRGVTLATAADGTAVVAFERYDPPNGHSVVMAASRAPGAPWQRAVEVGRPGAAYEYGLDPDAAAGTRGRAVVVWSDRGSGILASSRSAAGTWSAPVELAGRGYGPKVAMATDGRALAAWATTDQSAITQRIDVRERAAGGRWAPVRRVTGPSGTSAGDPVLAMGARGQALLAVPRGEGTSLAVHVATRLTSGPFDALRRLPVPMAVPPPPALSPAVDAAGAIAGVAWRAGDRVRYVSRRPGAAWSPVRSLGAASQPPALAAAGGRLLVAWVRNGDEIAVREVRS
ncbi:MAG: hypothetical protein QOD86_614 [Miltoncostaeaceae bacterium]|nr:hypothetical protein [Miltoncostaeaceae bacterium]